jgi:hypothetical protein
VLLDEQKNFILSTFLILHAHLRALTMESLGTLPGLPPLSLHPLTHTQGLAKFVHPVREVQLLSHPPSNPAMASGAGFSYKGPCEPLSVNPMHP